MAMKAKQEAEAKTAMAQPKATTGFSMAMGDCDLGASPQISKGSVFTKKFDGMLHSPLARAD